MKKITLIIFLFFFVMGISQNAQSPKISIKIPLGETITIENHQIKFVKVLEDSRCPKDVTCIWAGRAKVLVEVTEEGKEPLQKELIFGQIKQGESKDVSLFSTSEKNYLGFTLKPYPSSEVSLDDIEYYILLIMKNKL